MTPEKFRVVVSTVLIIGVGLSAVLLGVGFASARALGWQS